ncbi:reverse transcriptase [Gossypium australe]|uniref:Reverse transcriptase n=1 Tax=Gossypium australe TaxID=47621 RepID=A0A5B6UCE5_9ROSI|nr:reverse transcriptase [Gossypium australe]
MVFLMETKLDQKRMERARRSCGFVSGLEMAAEGSRGGLCLAWKGWIEVTLRSFSNWHIDVLVKEDNAQEEWRFTGFYGSPYLKDKNVAWNLLKRLGQECSYPWLVAGDFNEILYYFEKSGGVPRHQRRMEAFRDVLDECQLIDLGYSGSWFTWERGNLPETNIRECLDRRVANESWMLKFPRGNVQHLVYSSSDHCPILINTDSITHPPSSRRFHFESWWTLEESFEGILQDFWVTSSASLVEKLELLQTCMKKWACGVKSKKGGLMKKLTEELEGLLKSERDDDTMARIIDTKIHLNMEIDKDEMYWEQRARANWLKMGDRNIAYFHKCATTRRRANTINKLVLDDGREISNSTEINEAATEFFEDLFTSRGCGNPHKVLEGIRPNISHEINDRLLSPFREEEIWLALNGMGPTKAPGSDGYPALFFQKFWHIVGKEVTEFCLDVLNGVRGAEQINITEIVLIPKILNPTSMVNFRPISLCTVLYKMVAKAIVNRLQDVMGLCIDEVQSAFVPGRLITDNVLVAYEILHIFRKKRTGKKGYIALKLHMSKAYDRVEWEFIKQVMIRMGFAERWVDLIMKCISSVSYAVNSNSYRGRIFQATRGLRQGDPLSPLLFLFCSEGLSSLMRTTKGNGEVKGAKASRRGPEISHLLFADDCMLFGEATDQWARNMKNILQEYQDCSGQCVNYNKSTIFYSSNTSEEAKLAVSAVLGVRSASNPEKYLGLPNVVGKRKRAAFQNLLDWINMRNNGWSTRWLSQGELINNEERNWNKDLIENTFPAAEAELILQIPLAIEAHDDLLVWNDEPSGEFSVRSSYKLVQSLDPTAYALQNVYREFYKKLWGTDIPGKIKILVWKLSWNYLSTQVNLHCRKLAPNGECPRCQNGEETMNHLFRDCPVSMGDRNSQIHEKINRSGKEMATFIRSYIKELDGVKGEKQITSTVKTKWRSPSGSKVKVNFDGAFSERTKQSASKVVARDSSGYVLISTAEIHHGVTSTFAAEAIACKKATQIAIEIQMREVSIEGDSLTVIKKCKKGDFDRSLIGPYINDILSLKSRATDLSFKFVPRSENTVAHILATEALKRKEEFYLTDGVPCYAKSQVENESVREPD